MSWFKIRPAVPKNAPKLEAAVEETLQCEHFQVAKVVRHGFPYQPTALAFDPVQNLLAIGSKSGSIRLIGRPGVDCHIKHEADFAVIQIMFLINEGALVSVCADDQLHLWSLRQKRPEIIHALKFQKERITFCHLPFQSKWLYIGTQKGNVHVLNLESFVLSGYIINWNKTIELIRRTHPGPVVHLSANQSDPSKLLIGYETGLLTMWDLKNKSAEFHYNCKENLKSVSWHHEGKQFICCQGDGSLTTWNVRSPQQPASTIVPHGKLGRDGKPETCRPINKVELCTNRNSEPFTIFSGGMPAEKVGQTPTLTIMHGSNTTVLEMEYQIIDFAVLCSTPWNNDFQDPYAVIVLLQNDFVVLDLTSPNYPCFENPCPMDIHESPVTACCYFANCPSDLMPAFYSVGYRQKKTGFSEKEWPVKGGEWPTVATSYEEIIITGHADGSLKFWNAPGVTLQVLYKLKTAKMFDDSKSNSVVTDSNDAPYAVQIVRLCVESRLLCVAGLSYVTLFRYNKQEALLECAAVEITLMYDISDGFDSPENEFSSLPTSQNIGSNPQNLPTCVRLKTGQRKWSAGYQPDLCCMLTWFNGEPPTAIASIALNSKYGLLALGNEAGLAIVDILQKSCLLNIGTPDLYGSMDPHSRTPRSPKLKSRSQGFDSMSHSMTPDDIKSPNFEQLQDRTDGATFSRSQSSSTSSLDNIIKEAVQCLTFGDVFARKSDNCTCACLWAGTSLGSVLILSINLPPDVSTRRTEAVSASPTGTVFRLKGGILSVSFLDSSGILIPSGAEPWRDLNREDPSKDRKSYTTGQQSSSSIRVATSSVSSGSSDVAAGSQQFAVLCSEKQARVVALPSQTCAYKVKITETSSVVRADTVAMRDSACLVCYLLNGRILTFSLPSLKPLLDVDLVTTPDVRVARTLCFSCNCNNLFFCSPSELQKVTLSADMCENLMDMLGELFIPCDMPEPPKQSIFRNLFSAGSGTLDREELFGERSGKPGRGVAKYMSGISQTQENAALASSEIGRAKMAAIERGEKLGELEERTTQMMLDAEVYSQRANQIKNKYKDRKWYQF